MDKYILQSSHKAAVESILSKYTERENFYSNLRYVDSFDYMEQTFDLYDLEEYYSFLLKNYKYSMPLFLEGEDLERHYNELESYNFVQSLYENVCNYVEDDISFNSELIALNELLFCKYTFFVLKDEFFSIDYKKYGFSSPKEMSYCLEAYIASKIEYKDKREVFVEFDDVVYCYGNYIHGDFRLSKYDISDTKTKNPQNENELLPFGIPKYISCISGYHSVEQNVLAVFLFYTHYANIKTDVVENFEEYYSSNFESENQRYGNFADAGSEPCHAGFLFISFKEGYSATIPTEAHTQYHSVIEDDKLCIYHDPQDFKIENGRRIFTDGKLAFKISKNEIEPLIKGLFEKVYRGNGRSSIFILKDAMEYYLNKILRKKG